MSNTRTPCVSITNKNVMPNSSSLKDLGINSNGNNTQSKGHASGPVSDENRNPARENDVRYQGVECTRSSRQDDSGIPQSVDQTRDAASEDDASIQEDEIATSHDDNSGNNQSLGESGGIGDRPTLGLATDKNMNFPVFDSSVNASGTSVGVSRKEPNKEIVPGIKNVVYEITCGKCGSSYIGQTSYSFQYIETKMRRKIKLGQDDRKCIQHFHSKKCRPKDARFSVLDSLPDTDKRTQLKMFYIKEFDTVAKGLNTVTPRKRDVKGERRAHKQLRSTQTNLITNYFSRKKYTH